MVTKTGTSNNEDLLGTSSDDVLDGSKFGTHRMYGLAGNDQLYGGTGNDLLDGGLGADVMYGGGGDDLYRVDNVGDVVSETTTDGHDSGGIDTVEASISFTLGMYFEKLALTGTSAINGTGNELDNRLKGNDAANVLNGMDGADNISGGAGNDVIIGGAGKDTLEGGSGADTFMFAAPDATSTDRITDFNLSEGDRLGIMSLDYGLREGRGLISGNLDASYFAAVSGFSPQGTATGHGQFLYNSSNNTLLWDKDGAGTAYSGVAIVTFSSNIGLTSSNIAAAIAVTDNNVNNFAPTAPATAQFVTNVGVATPAEAIGATDRNGDQLTYSIKPGFGPQHGTVTFDQNAGTFTYKPTVVRPAAIVPSYDHIVVVMEENKDYDQVIGNSDAPYLNLLAHNGALLTNYLPITHPSQPNYFALYAGSTFGITDDNHYSLLGPTLATTLQAAGKSFAGFVEQKDGSFAHNPWESFTEGFSVERSFSTFPTGNFSDLPTVSFVIPNLNDDMHNGTVQQGDTWLRDNLDSYAQWARNNNSLLVITYDEGNHSYPGPIPAIMYGANIVSGQYNAEYTHYNMLSTILGASGLTAPNNAGNAIPIDVFQQSTPGETGTDTFTILISDGYGGTTEQQVTVDSQALPSLPLVHSSASLVKALDTSFNDPSVQGNYNIGAIDPAGIVWVPAHGSHPGTLFVTDSEVDEPAATNDGFTGTNSLFTFNNDLTPQVDPARINPQQDSFKFNLASFTTEPTGLAYNPQNGFLYISDDDQYKIFWVNPDDPTKKLGEFSVKPAGATDPEDIAINPNNGNIFISNGTPSHSITEVTSTGAFVSTTTVPDVVRDMEALAYDAEHDLFFVGGGFSSNVWVLNRAGTIVDTIDLSAFRNPISGTHVAVKDLAFAPTSDPNDDPNNMNLFVADYGLTHLPTDNDGRVLEINLGWHAVA